MESKKQTAVEWLFEQLPDHLRLSKDGFDVLQQAKQMEAYNSKMQAKRYYLKGFEDAELTETQPCSHEQTMRDAETHFELVYPLK